MVTIGLVLLAVLLVLVCVGMVWNCATSPFWFPVYWLCGSFELIGKLLGMVFEALLNGD